ncbi:hypothetical protein [uncultured Fibrella sp.]|uniref:hypothetical protein n=1 Tax=uncultured Fibrella sp. TaxID=1284596 RepID=UPI0035CC37CB
MNRLLHILLLLLLSFTGALAQSTLFGDMEVHPGGKVGVYNSMTLNSGYVITPRQMPPSNIAWQPGSVAVGGSDGSHVNGYAETTGNTAFRFPIGNGTTLRTAGISAPASGTFSAAYFSTNPSSGTLPTGSPFSTASLGSGVTGVSPVEYWDINGPSAVQLTLSWDANSSLNTLTGSTLSNLVIVGWDGSKWVNLGGTATGTLSGTGTITTTTAVVPNTYTAYTFGSATGCAAPSVGGLVTYRGQLPLCISSNAGSLTLTGQTGAVTGWETSTDGGTTWSALSGTVGKDYYSFVNAQNNQQYRAIVSNGSGCQSATATAVSITTSNTACTSGSCDKAAGIVSINTVAQTTGSNLTQQVILTDASGTIRFLSVPGNYSINSVTAGDYLAYQVTFDNTLTLPTLSVGTNLTAVGGACVKYSNQLPLRVCAPPTVAISGPALNAVVTTTNPPITGTATAGSSVTITGGPGSSGGPCVVTAANDGSYTCTSLTFASGPATVTAIASNSAGVSSPAVSNFSVVGCQTPTVAGTASFTGNPLCSVANAGTVTLTGQTGAIVRWETSTDNGGTFSPIANATTSLSFTNAQNGQQYRAVLQNGASCGLANSAPATIMTSSAACSTDCAVQVSVITK